MSHFTVLVVGDNPELQLAPFQENNMGDCPREYMSFHNSEIEYQKDWETGYDERFRNIETGKIVQSYDNELYKPIPQEVIDPFKELSPYTIGEKLRDIYPNGVSSKSTGSNGMEYRYRDETGYEKVLIPYKELYPDYHKDFLEGYHGIEQDESTGIYGYWHNPNQKWDWYVLGGRWDGFFKLKSKENSIISLFNKKAGYCNQALKKYIDFESIRQESADKAAAMFDYYATAFKDQPIPSWDKFYSECNQDDEGIQKARNEYKNHPVIQAIMNLQKQNEEMDFELYLIDDYNSFFHNGNRESFIKQSYDNAISTYAVLMDGKWYERGGMNWWGAISDKNDDWGIKFKELLDSIPDDTLLSVFDCHI